MSNPQFLGDLEIRLAQHGLSRRYVRRVIAELCDHYDAIRSESLEAGADEAEAEHDAEARLASDPQTLVEAIVTRGRARHGRGPIALVRRCLSYAAREHALFTFGLLPVLLMLGIGGLVRVVGVFTYGFIVDVLHVDNMHPVLRTGVTSSFNLAVYGTTPLLAWFFCRLAERNGRSMMLALTSCMLLALGGGMLKLDLVQCLASKHVAYFQRYGPDIPRLALPMIVFFVHSVTHLLWPRRCALPTSGN